MLGTSFHDSTLAEVTLRGGRATLVIEDYYVGYDHVTDSDEGECRLRAVLVIEGFSLIDGDPRCDLSNVEIIDFHLQADRTFVFVGQSRDSGGDDMIWVKWTATFERLIFSVTDDPLT